MIKGWWYPSGSSARCSAELSATGDQFTVTADCGDTVSGSVDELEISHRVGNITRRIALPDQSLFETEDNDGVDRLLHEFGGGTHAARLLHNLETGWPWIGAAFVITVLVVFSVIYWGLPLASKQIAYSLPPSIMRKISKETVGILDKGFLEPSELPKEKQTSIRDHFKKKLLSVQSNEFSYHMEVRKMGKIPNAFALPSGTIIVTDRLVELA
ncbi:MAG: M48 family metallopeptidase, partial [Gammaproteobacteria bacterium]